MKFLLLVLIGIKVLRIGLGGASGVGNFESNIRPSVVSPPKATITQGVRSTSGAAITGPTDHAIAARDGSSDPPRAANVLDSPISCHHALASPESPGLLADNTKVNSPKLIIPKAGSDHNTIATANKETTKNCMLAAILKESFTPLFSTSECPRLLARSPPAPPKAEIIPSAAKPDMPLSMLKREGNQAT